MKKENLIPTTILLRPDQMEALRKFSELTDVPQARMIRRGIDQELRRLAAAQQGEA